MNNLLAFLAEYWPSILMLLIGYGLVVLEMYLPGFGAPGIIGTLLLIGGIYFAHPSMLAVLVIVLVLAALLCVAFTICIRSAGKGRLSRSKLVLQDVATQAQTTETNDMLFFVGHEGVTHTVLRPAGMADFDGVKLNVVSDGEYVAAGAKVRAERVEGNRIVVREIKD